MTAGVPAGRQMCGFSCLDPNLPGWSWGGGFAWRPRSGTEDGLLGVSGAEKGRWMGGCAWAWGPSSLGSLGHAHCGGQGPAGLQCPRYVMAVTGGTQVVMAGGGAPPPQTVLPNMVPKRIWEEVWFVICSLLRNICHVQSHPPTFPTSSPCLQIFTAVQPGILCPACLSLLQYSVLGFPTFPHHGVERPGWAAQDRQGRN